MKMRQVIPISVALWILISTGDYILNNNLFMRMIGVDLASIIYNVTVPLTLAVSLTLHYKKLDYLWWIILPLCSGFEDILCIGTDWLMGLPTPNNFFWLHLNPLIEGYRILFGHPYINMGTLVLGVLTSIAICIILSFIFLNSKKLMQLCGG
jgi:hypothetical protein